MKHRILLIFLAILVSCSAEPSDKTILVEIYSDRYVLNEVTLGGLVRVYETNDQIEFNKEILKYKFFSAKPMGCVNLSKLLALFELRESSNSTSFGIVEHADGYFTTSTGDDCP